jgi:pyruvate-formate lyase-activating enzyme
MEKLFCKKPFIWLATGDNDKYWCCCSGWLPKPLADLSEDPMEVWNGPEIQEIRQSMIDGDLKFCTKDCPYLTEKSGPVKRQDQIKDPFLLDIINNKRTVIDTKPTHLHLCNDRSCNLGCPSCRSKLIQEGHEGDTREIQVVKSLLDENMPQLLNVCGGGDPLGSPSYRKFLQELDPARYPHLNIHLHTNGLLLKGYWETIPIRKQVHSMLISIDAATPETYEINRWPGKWKKLIENLEFVSGLRARQEVKSVVLAFVVQANNFREMPDFVKLAMRYGFDGVNFTNLRQWAFTEKEYLKRAVHNSDHPEHQAMLQVLRDPAFRRCQIDISMGYFDPWVRELERQYSRIL